MTYRDSAPADPPAVLPPTEAEHDLAKTEAFDWGIGRSLLFVALVVLFGLHGVAHFDGQRWAPGLLLPMALLCIGLGFAHARAERASGVLLHYAMTHREESSK